jgi:hypothetical protein
MFCVYLLKSSGLASWVEEKKVEEPSKFVVEITE